MKRQTAIDIASAVRDTAENKLRLTAMELALETHSPALFAAYKADFDRLRNSKAHETFLESLLGLQKRLESE